MPQVWTKIAKAAQKRERPEWANEKPKLDSARKLRGIYFIDPENEENKETFKKRKEKLEVPMDAAITSRRKGSIRYVSTIWCTSFFLCLKR